MIISKDEKKDKIKYPFMIKKKKTTRKLGIEGNFFHLMKAIYGKTDS